MIIKTIHLMNFANADRLCPGLRHCRNRWLGPDSRKWRRRHCIRNQGKKSCILNRGHK